MLNNSDHHPVLFLSNLVEGTYTFHLKVTDAKGESDTDRATVEVKSGEDLTLREAHLLIYFSAFISIIHVTRGPEL